MSHVTSIPRCGRPYRSAVVAIAVVMAASLLPATAGAEILFQEDFEDSSAAPRFGFTGYNDNWSNSDQYFTGQLASTPHEHLGHVWQTTFHESGNDSYFGHRLIQPAGWDLSTGFHWGFYVKFGDEANADEWATDYADDNLGQRSYELKFPDIGGGQPGRDRIIGKFRAYNGTNRGVFIVHTENSNGARQIHSTVDVGGEPFVSGRWYAVEFALVDRGAQDTVRIWVNNDDRDNPDYEYTGGDMFQGGGWTQGLRWDHGYRNHDVPRDTNVYYDQITIADSFIGLEPVSADHIPPSPPGGLRIVD